MLMPMSVWTLTPKTDNGPLNPTSSPSAFGSGELKII